MTDIEQVAEEAKAVATEASKQGKFSFLDRLAGRDYPTEEVEIYLDEAAGYTLQKLQDQHAKADSEQANVIDKQIEFQKAKAAKSRFVLHLEGISTEEYDSVIDDAEKEFPLEYRESRNPLSMRIERELIESNERERYLQTHIWAKFIRSVTDPEGNVDDEITPEWVAVFMNKAPVIAQAKVMAAVNKLRMVTDWMDNLQTDDFLAKS